MDEQTHYLVYLTSKFNFMNETAFNLHLPLIKAGFRKSHSHLQRTSPLGCE
jgi:hypothetical protein